MKKSFEIWCFEATPKNKRVTQVKRSKENKVESIRRLNTKRLSLSGERPLTTIVLKAFCTKPGYAVLSQRPADLLVFDIFLVSIPFLAQIENICGDVSAQIRKKDRQKERKVENFVLKTFFKTS